MTRPQPFDPAPVLARLKDFQRRTVDYAFQRLYLDDPPALRFLVADEVGLGKTLVAKGIIARALDHLSTRVKRVDVIYVCSNASIARQNVNRLNVVGTSDFAMATRLTLLPTQVQHLEKNPVNFVSFTPGTALEPKSTGGIKEERQVLYRMLRGEPWLDSYGLLNLLQAGVGRRSWLRLTKDWSEPIDRTIRKQYVAAVAQDPALRQELVELTQAFHRYRENVPRAENERRYQLIGELRRVLAEQCLAALEPDLIILDEFQRFRDLLDGDNPAAALAQALFRYPGARVLLLSATPYKLYSLDTEQADDHYTDFFRMLGFLLDDPAAIACVEEDIRELRRLLLERRGGSDALEQVKASFQRQLQRVMCRTERVGMTARLDAMLTELPDVQPLLPADLHQVRSADAAARALQAPDVIEYWKSVPYLLNFLRHYKLRERLDAAAGSPPDAVLDALMAANHVLLQKALLERYAALQPGNARMRGLVSATVDRGLWQLLWLPPSLPYWRPRGAYAEVGDITKSLVFSSWAAVPDAIAVVCSYEAERRAVAHLATDWGRSDLYDKLKAPLRFTVGREGRLTGMPALAVLLPFPGLATLVDPLSLGLALCTDAPPSLDDVRRVAVERLVDALAPFVAAAAPGAREDERWYWVAPALLERSPPAGLLGWLQKSPDFAFEAEAPEDDGETRLVDHLDHLLETVDRAAVEPLGPPPADLADVLAELALAGPGTAALRALRRVAPELASDDPDLLDAAAHVGMGLRSLFNLPESVGVLRQRADDTPYWRQVLQHGLDGNLQAVLDEQVHVLVEAEGLAERPAAERAAGVAAALVEALSLRTAQLHVDELTPRPRARRIDIEPVGVRCRFALRFADIRDDKATAVARAETVRKAFNSPFRPFVLASTSIGQEGLDFHVWCHAVVHWNLPSNPVDLEQREGRVHRYKGHAVRKNAARRFGLAGLNRRWAGAGDPWVALFELAAEDRPPNSSDLVPYWVYEVPGGASVERRVPLLPFSREHQQLRRLKQGVALYRLVFGQPRQEDLLEYLREQAAEGGVEDASGWRICLEPPAGN